MLLLKLILMLTLVTASDPEDGGAVAEPTTESPTIVEPLCGPKMKCLVPKKCTSATAAASADLVTYSAIEDGTTKTIDRTCTALFKIRVYTKKKWLIVLKSYDPNVKKIVLEKGSTKYVCEKECDVEITGTPNDKKNITLINKSKSPLMCEFTVETDADDATLDNDIGKPLSLSVDNAPPFTLIGANFIAYTLPTCNSLNAVTPQEGSVGEKMVMKVEDAFESQDLICKAPYSLAFRDTSASEFKTASAIKCIDHNKDNKFGYSAITDSPTEIFFTGTFEARCEARTCTMCATDPPKLPWENESQFSITVRPDGCQELKCKNGGRLLLKGSNKYSIDVLCGYLKEHGNVFLGKVNEDSTPILPYTQFECRTEVKCKEEEARELCPECVVNKHNLPQCSTTSKLKWYDGQEASVSCDTKTGEIEVKNVANGKSIGARAKDPLICKPIIKEVAPPPPPASGCTEEQVAELSKKYNISIGFLVVALFIIAILIAYIVVEKKRAVKAKKAGMGPSGKAVPIKMPTRSGRRKGPHSNSSGSGSIEPPAANSKSTTTPDKTLETPGKEQKEKTAEEMEKEKEEAKEKAAIREKLEKMALEREREMEKELEREKRARMTPAERMAALNVNQDNPYTPDESHRRPGFST